ncbi:hypothetical protein Tco_0858491, partial [Tanacetum coccineum]
TSEILGKPNIGLTYKKGYSDTPQGNHLITWFSTRSHPLAQLLGDKMPRATSTDISLTKSYIPKVSKIPGISPTIAKFYKSIENRNIHEGRVVDQAYYKYNNIEPVFTNEWDLASLEYSQETEGPYSTDLSTPGDIRRLLELERVMVDRTIKSQTATLTPNQILIKELSPDIKQWEELIRENVIKCARTNPTANLPYGMFLTRLYRHIMEAYPQLDNSIYDIVDRVMRPLSLKQTRRPRSDCVKAHHSVSSSSSHHHGTPSHQHDDDDDDDVETSRHEHVVMNPTPAGMRHHHLHLYIQRISLTGFPAQSVRSSNTDVLDLPCLLVLITGTSQSRQHIDTSSIHIESHKSPTKSLFDAGSSRISIFIIHGNDLEVSPDESCYTSQPLEQVTKPMMINDVFANVRRHSEQLYSGNKRFNALKKANTSLTQETEGSAKLNIDVSSRAWGRL